MKKYYSYENIELFLAKNNGDDNILLPKSLCKKIKSNSLVFTLPSTYDSQNLNFYETTIGPMVPLCPESIENRDLNIDNCHLRDFINYLFEMTGVMIIEDDKRVYITDVKSLCDIKTFKENVENRLLHKTFSILTDKVPIVLYKDMLFILNNLDKKVINNIIACFKTKSRVVILDDMSISSNSDVAVEIRLGNKDVRLLNSLDQYSIFKFGDKILMKINDDKFIDIETKESIEIPVNSMVTTFGDINIINL